MIADYYDDTKNVKLFIRFFHFIDCSNQVSITSVRNKIFWYCKKYFWSNRSVEYDSIKKLKTKNDGFWDSVSHFGDH